jgi:2-oxoglutarate ferredoxin oxidoreductase subunit alpha
VRAYPFHKTVAEFIARHDRVYVVEQNRDAQMLSLLKLDLPVEELPKLRSIRHYNGLPIDARTVTDEFILQEGI